jgi:hypothetical protein
MVEDKLDRKIRVQIQHEMKPVRALAPVRRRALPLLLIWPVLAGLVLMLFGLRSDSDVLGLGMTWGLPALQLLSAYAIIVLALRLTIPGSSAPASLLAFLALLGIAIHFVIAEMIFRVSPTRVEATSAHDIGLICFFVTLALSLIPSLFVIVLARQGLTPRPLFLGLVCGIACGLSGEAIWRMHCSYNAWDHILKSHSGPILAAGLIGFLIGFLSLRHRQH